MVHCRTARCRVVRRRRSATVAIFGSRACRSLKVQYYFLQVQGVAMAQPRNHEEMLRTVRADVRALQFASDEFCCDRDFIVAVVELHFLFCSLPLKVYIATHRCR